MTDPTVATPAARLLPYGPAAVLVEVDDPIRVAELTSLLTDRAPDGVVDIVPAARTVMVTAEPGRGTLAAVGRLVRDWTPGEGHLDVGATHEIPVRYAGPDLEAVAETTGMTTDEVVATHSGAEYRVAFCGFAPGFGYLTGLPEILHLPRLENPRAVVPPRSVAIAGEFSAVYPRESPGGWNLIGEAQVSMWDDSRGERPNLLAPGDVVRFVPC